MRKLFAITIRITMISKVDGLFFRFLADGLGQFLDCGCASHFGDNMASLHGSDHWLDNRNISAMFSGDFMASVFESDSGSSCGNWSHMMGDTSMEELRIGLTLLDDRESWTNASGTNIGGHSLAPFLISDFFACDISSAAFSFGSRVAILKFEIFGFDIANRGVDTVGHGMAVERFGVGFGCSLSY